MTTNLNEELKEVETLETEVHAAKTHFADLMRAVRSISDQREKTEEYWQEFVENNPNCLADDLDKATNDGHTST